MAFPATWLNCSFYVMVPLLASSRQRLLGGRATYIDLEGNGKKTHDEPLIVVDPVDPNRNVAAALTLDKMLQFAAVSQTFLKEPGLDFFFPKSLGASVR